MRPLRLIGYIALVGAFFGLASGQLLRFPDGPGSFFLYSSAAGGIFLSAALALYCWKRSAPPDRLAVYWTCVGVLTSIQLTGGDSSLFYPVYLLCLLWVSLPSVGGSAMELGLLGGLTSALALLLSGLIGGAGEGSFFARLLPLLPPSLKLLLVPFLFGLAAEWMSRRELAEIQTGSFRTKSERAPGADPPRPSDDYRRHLLEILHRNAGASQTCLFLRHGEDSFRLEASCPEGGDVIPKFLLPAGHRLVRMLTGMGEPVSIGIDSAAERRELLSYRRQPLPEEVQSWIALCPLSRGGRMEGILMQDFCDGRPAPRAVQDLQSAAHILLHPVHGMGSAPSEYGDDSLWIARLASAGTQESLDSSVHGIASLLAEALPEATVSVAAVDAGTGRARMWVSRGPLANRRRDKTSSGGGIAGWVIKNREPYYQTRMNSGPRSLHAFSDSDDIQSVTGSCIGVPVLVAGEIKAIIVAEHESDDAFVRSHESLLLAAAGILSMAMELDDLREMGNTSSDIDTLTRLPRITPFYQQLRHLASHVGSYGGSVGVIVADIDGFSRINRDLGYSSGDQVLREAAQRFRALFPADFVARIGHDGFAACVPKADRADLEAFLPRLFEAMSWEFAGAAPDHSATITVSIGACHTKINRKVLLLAAEAEAAAVEAAKAGPRSQVIRRIGVTGTENG